MIKNKVYSNLVCSLYNLLFLSFKIREWIFECFFPLDIWVLDQYLFLHSRLHHTDGPLSLPTQLNNINSLIDPLSLPTQLNNINSLIDPLSLPAQLNTINSLIDPLSLPAQINNRYFK